MLDSRRNRHEQVAWSWLGQTSISRPGTRPEFHFRCDGDVNLQSILCSGNDHSIGVLFSLRSMAGQQSGPSHAEDAVRATGSRDDDADGPISLCVCGVPECKKSLYIPAGAISMILAVSERA